MELFRTIKDIRNEILALILFPIATISFIGEMLRFIVKGIKSKFIDHQIHSL